MKFYSESRNSARSYAVGMAIFSVLFCASIRTTLGQERSTDRDHPTMLTSNEISDDLDGSGDEYFYQFDAGPGKVTVTFEVTASGTNAGAHLDLFDTNSKSILSNVLAQGVDGGTERVVKSVQIAKLRHVVLRVQGIKYGDEGGTGVYKIRLDGAVSFKTPDAPKDQPVSFAGCWKITGNEAFGSVGLGCFEQKGDRVDFLPFAGTVTGNTLRFALTPGSTTALAYKSGHFVMDPGGKSIKGSLNASLNPDDNEHPVTGTLVPRPTK